MKAVVAMGSSKNYTDGSISGISGSLAGKNCTIKSITAVTGGQEVVFEWTADDGTVQTSSMVVKDGSKGAKGNQGKSVASVAFNANGKLVFTLDDGTELTPLDVPSTMVEVSKAAGNIIQQKADGMYAPATDLTNYVQKELGKGLSTNDYDATEKAEVAKIKNKVDKVTGKGLSTNDYDNTEKAEVAKVAGKVDKAQGVANKDKFLKVGADGNVTLGDVPSGTDIVTAWGTTTSDAKVPSEKLVKDNLDTITQELSNLHCDIGNVRIGEVEDATLGKHSHLMGFTSSSKSDPVVRYINYTENGKSSQERLLFTYESSTNDFIVKGDANGKSDTFKLSNYAKKTDIDGKADKSVEKSIADNWNGNGYNLIPYPYAEENTVTRGGVTFTVNEDGTVKANGTSTGGAWLYLWNYQQGLLIEKGKTYVISDGIESSDYRMELAFYKNGSSVGTSILDNGNGTKFTAPNDDTYDSVRLALWVRTGITASNVVYKPMLVEVNADGTYPTEYQRYASGNVELTDEISQKEQEITDLKMLGYTVPSECPIQNYTDANGVFHQRVGRVDLGSLTWTLFKADLNIFSASVVGIQNTTYAQMYSNIYNLANDKSVSEFANMDMRSSGNSAVVFIRNTSYSDADAFKSALTGQYLYYELATEVTKSVDGNEYGIFDKGQTTSTTCTKNAVTQIQITFNKTFNSAPTVVATMVTNSSGVDVGNMTVAVMNITTTGATLYVYNNGASDRKPAFNWIAIQ